MVTGTVVKAKQEKLKKKVFSLPGQRFEPPEEVRFCYSVLSFSFSSCDFGASCKQVLKFLENIYVYVLA